MAAPRSGIGNKFDIGSDSHFLPVVLQRLGLIFTLLSVFAMSGGHWGVLQGIAWTGMLIKYAQDAPLMAAFKKTFSGEAPCAMCKKIAKKSSEENQNPANISQKKAGESFLVGFQDLLPKCPWTDFSYPVAQGSLMPARFKAPPAPVPIFLQAVA